MVTVRGVRRLEKNLSMQSVASLIALYFLLRSNLELRSRCVGVYSKGIPPGLGGRSCEIPVGSVQMSRIRRSRP